MTEHKHTYSLIDEGEQESLKAAIQKAYAASGTPTKYTRGIVEPLADSDEGVDGEGLGEGVNLMLSPPTDLIGIEPSVYRQIEAAINSGKQHLLFYGPPGTGKTTLARWLAGILSGSKWTLITGSADWSSQDIIGGYQPMAGGTVKFFPGVLLKNFDRPLVIDELNRCDIDKVVGPLFTVLSGQATTLPYRTDATNADSPQYTILPKPKPNPAAHEFSPTKAWRLIATINSIDKASLYQMSYALSRRFGWIYVDAPKDTKAFVQSYVEKFLDREPKVISGMPPLAAIWAGINLVRPIGPAPIVDALKTIDSLAPNGDLLGPPEGDLRVAYIDAVELYLLPLLEGILRHEAESVSACIVSALALADEEGDAERLKQRILSIAL